MNAAAPLHAPRWAQLTSAAHSRSLDTATLVLPIGATEQHGPHLPVGVDAMVSEHIAVAAAGRVSTTERPILVAPVLAYGSSHHHLPLPGTLSLSSRTMASAVVDILASAAVTGYRRLFVLNGHGGNEDIARQAARDVALEHDVVTACVGYWSLAWDQVLVAAERHGIAPVPGHAGSFETSIVLSLWPELAEELPDRPTMRAMTTTAHPFSSVVIETHRWVHATGGFTDDPSRATAEGGRAVLEVLVDACAGWLARFAAGDEPTLTRPKVQEPHG